MTISQAVYEAQIQRIADLQARLAEADERITAATYLIARFMDESDPMVRVKAREFLKVADSAPAATCNCEVALGESCPQCMNELVSSWAGRKKKKGEASCPCGFVGGSRNIRRHRLNCPVWSHYCKRKTNTADQPGEAGK